MAFSTAVYGVISQVLEDLREKQSPRKKKANTVVVAIGTVIAALVGGISYLLESGVDGLPGWLPTALVWLTMLASVFVVNKTKNGITPSTIKEVEGEISRRIDSQPRDGGHPGVIPDPVVPSTSSSSSAARPASDVASPRDAADELDAIAKRLA